MKERRRGRWGKLAIGTEVVLLISADPTIQDPVFNALHVSKTKVLLVKDVEEAVELLYHYAPSVILLDGDPASPLDTKGFLRTRERSEWRDVPVIVILPDGQQQVFADMARTGVSDYLEKPLREWEIQARVQPYMERRRLLDGLERATNVDALTGLPNRTLLSKRLKQAIARKIDDPGYRFAVMFIDFDRFKQVNDSLGHAMGDMLLREVAARLRQNLRIEDGVLRNASGSTLARFAGDEFIVLLEAVQDAEAASIVATRLLAALDAPYQIEGHLISSSASIGIAHSDQLGGSVVDILRDADIAMYEAKRRGKGRYAVFSPGLREATESRLSLEAALRSAIGTPQLHLNYQPIVSLEDRRMLGVEVLLRWQHPQLGEVPPANFIPVAEDSGLIFPLSEQVLYDACQQFISWQREWGCAAPQLLSVNLSRVELADPGAAGRVLSILRDTGMPPGSLQLEVTESQIVQQRELAEDMLVELRSHGVRLAMDDFGTGYSSLSCLQEYPFDTIKIDRAMTSNINRGRGYSALLHAVVSLADNLGLEVIAEGIETIDQLVLLQALGCGYGQGFLLGKPMSADGVRSWWEAEIPGRDVA